MQHVTDLPTKHGRGLRLHGDQDAEEKQPEEQILEASNHRDERKVTTLRELLQRPDLETAPMWVGNGLLPRSGFIMVAGKAKEENSALVSQLCLSLLSGKPFLNQFSVEGVPRILYLHAEGSERLLRDIFASQVKGLELGLDDERLTNLIMMDGRHISLNNQTGFDEVGRLVKSSRADICVIDYLGLFCTDDINSSRVVKRLTEKFNNLSAKTDACFVLIRYFRPPRLHDKRHKSIHRILGSGAWGAHADAIWGLERAHSRTSDNLKKLQFVLRRGVAPKPTIILQNPSTKLFAPQTKSISHGRIKVEDIARELRACEPDGASASKFTEKCSALYDVSLIWIYKLLQLAKSQGLAFKGEGCRGKWHAGGGRNPDSLVGPTPINNGSLGATDSLSLEGSDGTSKS